MDGGIVVGGKTKNFTINFSLRVRVFLLFVNGLGE